MATYLIGLLTIANVFIALFLLIYVFSFLKRTVKQKDRRPWDILFAASIFYLSFQVTSLLTVKQLYSVEKDITHLRIFLEFLFSSFILLTFITQYELILSKSQITIRRKPRRRRPKRRR